MDKEKGLQEIDQAEWKEDKFNYLNLYVTDEKGQRVHCWLSLRPTYCDRGHIQLNIDGALGLDHSDSFPRFFFSFEEADKHTRLFLKWRLWKHRIHEHKLGMNKIEVDLDNPLLKEYNGMAFLSDGLDGAPIKIGTKIKKANSEKGDTTPDGTEGLVIGSISYPVSPKGMGPDYCYTVVWDNKKDFPVSTVGKKLEVVDEKIHNA